MTEHLHALAMRTAALKVIDPGTGDFDLGLWFAVKALPIEADHAGLLAEAVKLDAVLALVIAAREAWEEPSSEFLDALDKALSPFSALVPYENEPDAMTPSNVQKMHNTHARVVCGLRGEVARVAGIEPTLTLFWRQPLYQ